jgi:HlyD family secretion protein
VTEQESKPDLSSLRIHRDERTDRNAGHHSRRRAWIWLVAIAVVAAIVVVYFLKGSRGVVEVETAMAQRLSPAAAQSLLTATGYVVAQRKAEVASKATGRLEVLNVEEGDWVTKGDILGQLEADDVKAALRAASASAIGADAEVKRAQAVAKETELVFKRAEQLLAQELISQAEFDDAEAANNSAKATVKSAAAAAHAAHANAEYAEVEVENTFIRAPFDGTVLTKNADVGEVVAPFASSQSSKGAIVTLADMSSLEVEADVSESNIQQITPNQPCVIVLDAFPADPYSGYVKKIVPTADRAKATVMVKVAFDNLDQRVLPEMSAKVSFLPADSDTVAVSTRSVITVPVDALAEYQDNSVVYVVRQNQVHRTPVETGRQYGRSIGIVSGVNVGDAVVLHPPARMQDGDAVRLKQ